MSSIMALEQRIYQLERRIAELEGQKGGLRLAQVVKVNPQRRTVNLVFMDDGFRAGEVEILSTDISSDHGIWNVPHTDPPPSEQLAATIEQPPRNLVAACAFSHGVPVVVGFAHPIEGQVVFTEQNRVMHRAPAGSYYTVNPKGHVEIYHPSGCYIRIGGEHEPIEPIAANKNWRLPTQANCPIWIINPNDDIYMEARNITMVAHQEFRITAQNQDVVVEALAQNVFVNGQQQVVTYGKQLNWMKSDHVDRITAPDIELEGIIHMNTSGP